MRSNTEKHRTHTTFTPLDPHWRHLLVGAEIQRGVTFDLSFADGPVDGIRLNQILKAGLCYGLGKAYECFFFYY